MKYLAPKKRLFVICFLLLLFVLIAVTTSYLLGANSKPQKIWKFESIDTMKYSRDLAREKLTNSDFDESIESQLSNIAATGATHVAIATPYDEEFLPILKRWVKSARRNHLKVWFRGNFSGWEEWFDYKKITRDEHLAAIKRFITGNPDLFEDGDVFTACPECENGGPGDPRMTGDVEGHRAFLIREYMATKEAFSKINKKVSSNYDSMNFDVAKLVMDRQTTKALDGIVTIDHYVESPEKLSNDIDFLAGLTGGKIVLGEMGAPIPDIHGDMSEIEQAEWLGEALYRLSSNKNLVGINYWVNSGGSTQLWNDDGSERAAVDVVRKYYTPLE